LTWYVFLAGPVLIAGSPVPQVPEYCPALDEESVSHKAFELIFAFDEIISYQGHREPVTLGQVKQFTDMDSHEEKLHNMIMQSKIQETKENMKRKANEIDKTRVSGPPLRTGLHVLHLLTLNDSFGGDAIAAVSNPSHSSFSVWLL
jgi:hypothetical protein